MGAKNILPIPEHYTVQRVAFLLGVSPRWVKDQVKAGNLVGVQLGNNDILVNSDSLRDYLANLEIKQPVARGQSA